MRCVAEGTSAAISETFFRLLVEHLAEALHVRYAFVSELIGEERSRARVLALRQQDRQAEPFEHAVAGTPCELLASEPVAYVATGLRDRYPDDPWLRDNKIDSYLAIVLTDSQGRPIGQMGIMDREPIAEREPAESILHIFAGRTSAELERLQTADALQQSEERIRQVAESVPICLISAEGGTNRMLLMVGAAKELFGYDPQQFMDDPDFGGRIIHPDDAEGVGRRYCEGLEAGRLSRWSTGSSTA